MITLLPFKNLHEPGPGFGYWSGYRSGSGYGYGYWSGSGSGSGYGLGYGYD